MNKVITFIAIIILKLQKNFLNLLIFLLFKKPKTIKKIAIYRFGSFGDSIVGFPAIKSIRKNFIKVEIHIYNKLVYKNLVGMKELLDENMYDKIFTIRKESKIEVFKQIKKEKYDIYIELSHAGMNITQAIKKIIFLKLAGVKYVFGFEITPNNFLSKYYNKKYTFISERERLLNNLSQHHINTNNYTLDFSLKSIDKNIETVTEYLIRDNIKIEKIVVLITKSKRDSNCWKKENWVKLANELINKNYCLVFIGGNSDKFFINSILEQINSKKAVSYAGVFSALDSAAILKLAQLVVSIDTGPMHLSYAVGTKVISIFSARDYPEKWFPPKNLGVVFRNEVSCSPCFLDKCPHDNKCINSIKHNEILAQL